MSRIIFTPLIVQGTKAWSGHTIYEQALGGSESAVVYLAREFARRGHEVTVFTTGQAGTFEKVRYLPQDQIPWGTPGVCDYWISSRWIDALLHVPDDIYKILWMHDLAPLPTNGLPCHKVVMLSDFHAMYYGLTPLDLPEFVNIEGDGVDLTLAAGFEDREPTLLWASNPNRGLWIASKIFVDEILPRWPDLVFKVYGSSQVYGWPKEVDIPYMPPDAVMERANGHIQICEPLPRLALVREMMKAFALFYPSHWPESYCMVTLEAQAAGTPVIASPYGALPYTVKGGILTNDFVNAVSQLRNHNRWTKLSEAGKEYAADHSWAMVAARWESNILGRAQ